MKTCFVYLLPNSIRNILDTSLKSLNSYYLNEYPTDVVIFHEKGFKHKSYVTDRLPRTNIIFKEIEFKIPNIIQKDKNFKPKWTESYWDSNKCLSYGGMCSFFAFDIFNYLIQMNYDYYARLDDDSIFLSKIKYNIFDHMKQNDLIYGYLIKMLESPHVVNGLFSFIKNNVNHENIINKNYSFEDTAKLVYYYNNFEIVDIKRYFTSDIIEINNKIHESGNVFYYRWGDAPIRTILLSMLFNEKNIKRLPNLDYKHDVARIINNICYDVPKGLEI